MERLPQELRERVQQYWSPEKEIKARSDIMNQVLVRLEISRLISQLWNYRETLSSQPVSAGQKRINETSLMYCLEALFEGCAAKWLKENMLARHVLWNMRKYQEMSAGLRSVAHDGERVSYPEVTPTIDFLSAKSIAEIITALVNDTFCDAVGNAKDPKSAHKIYDVYRDIYEILVKEYRYIDHGYTIDDKLPIGVGKADIFGNFEFFLKVIQRKIRRRREIFGIRTFS